MIVKGYKVLFYKEKALKESKGSRSALFEGVYLRGVFVSMCMVCIKVCELSTHPMYVNFHVYLNLLISLVFIDSQPGTPIWRSKGSYQSLQRQFSCTSSPLWGRDEDDEISDVDTKIVLGSKLLPMHNMGEGSPRGVLDGPGLSLDSDSSPPSSTYSSLSHSLSRKGLLSCVSSQEDGNESFREQPPNCLSLWRSGTIRRTSTFPPPRRLRKFSGPLDYTSMRNSFKSYVNTLWGTESMSHDPPILADGQQNWRCFFYEELAFATNDFNPGFCTSRYTVV